MVYEVLFWDFGRLYDKVGSDIVIDDLIWLI